MYIADLHIHSKYSRATSRDCDAPHLDHWARLKGIALLGTGDFTHPAWREELRASLVPAEEGLYCLRDELRLPARVEGAARAPRFVVSGEISTIYKRDGRTRKVHHVILLPGLEAAESLAQRLEAVGNIRSDGRPILGLDSRDLLALTLETCPEAIYIPAHIWTPHFSVLGAFSSFSSVEECYGDLAQYIFALETGLSSDPPMNRRLSLLDRYTLVSNSDAHSPPKLGREANLLHCALSYPALRRALETGEGFGGTIEFFPEEGKYHLDGHRACGCCLEPAETMRLDGRCPVCGRKVTVGVLHRVQALSDRPQGLRPGGDAPFESLMPLPELLADCLGASPASKRVQAAYDGLLERLGTEFQILRELPLEDVERAAGFAVAEGLRRLRTGLVIRLAGYDGEYGVIRLFAPGELAELGGQMALFTPLALPARARARAVERTRPAGETATPPDAPDTSALMRLNERQLEAVRAPEAAVAVVAGPGTGKTRTLVARIAHLMGEGGVPGSQIAAITFTNQAAQELRERLAAQLGGKKGLRGLTVGTFHAICLSLLPEKPLIAQMQARALVGELLAERGDGRSPADCLRMISRAKNGLEADLPAGLLEAYDARLRALGARDLDDVLLEALATDVRGKRMFTHLLVDEFQDINRVQHQLVRHFSAQGRSLFAIGDPDQSIYGFRGANAACFDEFRATWPEARVVSLAQNYRSTPEVLRCALAAIAPNNGRERALAPTRASGAPVRVMAAPDGFSEGVWIAKEIARLVGGVDMLDAQAERAEQRAARAFSDIAILCRTHRQLDQIENCLRHDDIPCLIAGREAFWDDPLVQGALGFFRALLDPRDALSLRCALKNLWRCPQALVQRAEAIVASQEALDPAALFERLGEHEALVPWLRALEALHARARKDKPRKLLGQLADMLDLDGKPVERLLNASVFHDDLAAFLQALLTGEEADIRRASGRGHAGGAVRLMTLHGAKGLEFPVVFLAGANQGELPLSREGRPADIEEERRLFFVGITRAQDELTISCGGEPSPFLADLPANVLRGAIRPRGRAPQAQQLSLFSDAGSRRKRAK